MKKRKLLIVDDHGVVIEGIKSLLVGSEDFEVIGEATNGQEALELVRSGSFDVVILDVSMPGRGGLDVLHELKAASPALRIIVLSMHPEEQYAIRSLRDGASAYLTKGCPPEGEGVSSKTR